MIIKNLDPLRAIAAMLVVVHHIPGLSKSYGIAYYDNNAIFERGPDAVLFFFVLSGFLISMLLYIEKVKTGTVRIGHFYLRRVLRIYPVYYLVLIIGFTFYHVILPFLGMPYDNQYELWEGVTWCVLFMPNVFVVDYDPGAILTVLWSIGVEEQFYILWAPLVSILPLKYIKQALLVLFIGFFLYIFGVDGNLLYRYRMLFFFFAAGGLMGVLSYINSDRLVNNALFSPAAQVAHLGLVAIYLFTNWLQDGLPEYGVRLIECFIFCYVILNLAFNKRALYSLDKPWLNYLGKVSYGIYMYHMIVLVVLVYIGSFLVEILPGWLLIILLHVFTIWLTVLVSSWSYKYFEKPFLKLKRSFRHS